jgi:hypothetical protein
MNSQAANAFRISCRLILAAIIVLAATPITFATPSMAQGQWTIMTQSASVCMAGAAKALESVGYTATNYPDGGGIKRLFTGKSNTMPSVAYINCYQSGPSTVYTIVVASDNGQADAQNTLNAISNYIFSPAVQPPSSGAILTPAAVGSSSAPVLFAVNCGGPAYRDSKGLQWAADTGSTGGNTGNIPNAITGTNDPTLYQSYRYYSNFSYKFNVPNGNHQVTLRFTEPYFNAAGKRIFNVTINGTNALTNFDIFVAAGGEFRAYDRAWNVNVTNGQITIQVIPVTDSPLISALEIQ